MIKFFRRIRQNLLSEGKTGKYFKYAFGEIILVVIGILIALQINNWNEDRKLSNELSASLIAIKNELEQDIVYYQELIESNIDRVDFLNSLSKGEYDNIELKRTSFVISKNFNPRQFGTSYYTIKENGQLNDIKDEDLKSQMILYYETQSIEFNNFSAWHRKFVAENIDSYLINDLTLDENAFTDASLVIEEMKNRKLPNIVNFQKVILERFRKMASDNIGSANKLIELVDREN